MARLAEYGSALDTHDTVIANHTERMYALETALAQTVDFSLTNGDTVPLLPGMPAILLGTSLRRASSSSQTLIYSIGLIASQAEPTLLASIRTSGSLDLAPEQWSAVGAINGLIQGATYYVGATPGTITTTPPTTQGSILLSVGRACSTTRLLIQLGTPVLL